MVIWRVGDANAKCPPKRCHYLLDMRLTLIGFQCAGKGTHGPPLAAHFKVPLVVISDLMRIRAGSGDEIADRIQQQMRDGEFVDDYIVTQELAARLAEPDAQAGFVLDGYPRRAEQGQTLKHALAALSEQGRLDAAVHLRISADEAMRRVTARLVCSVCKCSTNISVAIAGGRCPTSGCRGDVAPRPDDINPESVATRLRTYEEETVPLIDYYRRQALLLEFDAERTPDEIFRDVVAKLDELPRGDRPSNEP